MLSLIRKEGIVPSLVEPSLSYSGKNIQQIWDISYIVCLEELGIHLRRECAQSRVHSMFFYSDFNQVEVIIKIAGPSISDRDTLIAKASKKSQVAKVSQRQKGQYAYFHLLAARLVSRPDVPSNNSR